MSPRKRIHHLRTKNKLLLDKLESHSSLIEAEIKYLKRKLRGKSAKPASDNDRNKNWTKRNSSQQVTNALSSYTEAVSDSALKKITATSGRKSLKSCSSSFRCDGENLCRNRNIDVNEDLISLSPGKPKLSPRHRPKSVRQRKFSVEKPMNQCKSIRDIISLIDYSPKSTFVKKMKSKFEPFSREVYLRVTRETEDPVQESPVEECHTNKKVKTEENPKITIMSSACSECGKRIERKPRICTGESAGSMEEGPSKHERVTMEEELERLKNFRAKNWQDCHASLPKCEALCCCGHRKCGTEIYGINDRLLAVPLDGQRQHEAHCPYCGKAKCIKSCCAHHKKVLVTLPTTLLDGDALNASKGRHVKGTKGKAPISKEVLKKLRRPVPQNSMALRYQKGVC